VPGVAVLVSLVIVACVVTRNVALAASPNTVASSNTNWRAAERNYIASLSDSNAGVRQSAALFIAEYHLVNGVRPLITMMKTDSQAYMRMVAAYALTMLGDINGIDAVHKEALQDSNGIVRDICAALLEASAPAVTENRQVDWAKAQQRYVADLTNENEGVRLSAAALIAEYRLTDATVPLIDILQKDKDETIRMTAAFSLVMLGKEEGLDAVSDASVFDGSDAVSSFCRALLNASNAKIANKSLIGRTD
jgi:HEAT repeat protein